MLSNRKDVQATKNSNNAAQNSSKPQSLPINQARWHEVEVVIWGWKNGKSSNKSCSNRFKRPNKQKLVWIASIKRTSIRLRRSSSLKAWYRPWRRQRLNFQSATVHTVYESESSSSRCPVSIATVHSAVKTWSKWQKSRKVLSYLTTRTKNWFQTKSLLSVLNAIWCI